MNNGEINDHHNHHIVILYILRLNRYNEDDAKT
jgi:hypothetical protein